MFSDWFTLYFNSLLFFFGPWLLEVCQHYCLNQENSICSIMKLLSFEYKILSFSQICYHLSKTGDKLIFQFTSSLKFLEVERRERTAGSYLGTHN